jgi:membrane protein CcdC involved in cytochrome C biogenesis
MAIQKRTATQTKQLNKRTKIFLVFTLVLLLMNLIKWIWEEGAERGILPPIPDWTAEVLMAARQLLLPTVLFAVGLLMFSSGFFASIGVALMVLGAVLFTLAIVDVVRWIKDRSNQFLQAINPFASDRFNPLPYDITEKDQLR